MILPALHVHDAVIRLPRTNPRWKRECGWFRIGSGGVVYCCEHVERCRGCHKVLRRHYSFLPPTKYLPTELRADECPRYTPRPAWEDASW